MKSKSEFKVGDVVALNGDDGGTLVVTEVYDFEVPAKEDRQLVLSAVYYDHRGRVRFVEDLPVACVHKVEA